MTRDVIDRIGFAGDEIDRFRQPEIAHIPFSNAHGKPRSADLLASQPAHLRREVDRVGPDAPACEIESRASGAAAEVARAFDAGEKRRENPPPSDVNGNAEWREDFVV